MRDATLRQLRAFSLVARHESFARAAEELNLSLSAVSLQIKDLETTVGLTLFGRRGRVPALTRAGELLLTNVNKALSALKDADEALSRLYGCETGSASIGMTSNAEYLLPRILAGFHAAHPGVKLQVTSGNRERLLRQLGEGDVEFAIMGEPPAELVARSEVVAPQPLGILAAPDHPFAGRRHIPPAVLAGCDFVVREPGSGTRAAMDRFFRAAGFAPRCVLELSSNESIKQAVIGNMGLAFLSLHTAGLELQAGALSVLDVLGLPLMRSWYVVDLPSKPMSSAAESLRQFILESGGGFISRQFQAREPECRPAEA